MKEFTISKESVALAIDAFVDAGMLRRVGHGYCWVCGNEKEVLDVIADEFPVQEPKCEDCIINTAMLALKFSNIHDKVFGRTEDEHGSIKET